MGILMKMGKNRALKKIARRLPPALISGYGYSESYSPGQVGTALESTGCNSHYLDHAYAMFCSQEDFNGACDEDYASLHQEVADICFSGNDSFNFSDVENFSGDASSGGVGGGDSH